MMQRMMTCLDSVEFYPSHGYAAESAVRIHVLPGMIERREGHVSYHDRALLVLEDSIVRPWH